MTIYYAVLMARNGDIDCVKVYDSEKEKEYNEVGLFDCCPKVGEIVRHKHKAFEIIEIQTVNQ